jgi:FkbM family methyltransferase
MHLKPRQLGGLSLLIDPGDWSQTVIFDEIFLAGGYELDKVPFSPGLILDCGAHIGMFTLLAKNRFPNAKLIAYEPNRENAGFIQSQIEKNKLDVIFINSAVSTEATELEFIALNSHGGRLANDNRGQFGDFDGATYKVKAVNLPEAFKEMRPESLLLKMDIEGEERSILPAIIPLFPQETALFFETHFGHEEWSEIDALLTANGFRVERTTDRGKFCDGFACRH